MGAHVGLVMRRLGRVARHYQNDGIRFIACSATISNPSDHFVNLIGSAMDKIHTVTLDGSPCGPKELVVWRSEENMFEEAARLIIYLMRIGLKSVVFCKYRKSCELLLRQVCQSLLEHAELAPLVDRIRSYRAGYQPALRR
jgi:DEAD/DEAH box helicase domain-containing protein